MSAVALSLPAFDWVAFWQALGVIVLIPVLGGAIPFLMAVLSELRPEKRRDCGKW